jgi:hypothetical protein
VLAFGKPFLLYCEPEAARLRPEFAADLARACRWSTTAAEFVAAVQELAAGARLTKDEPAIERFLERYVLHDGHPADAVASFLGRVCRDGLGVDAETGSA